MTRDEAIGKARDAARQAATLAGHAESAAHHSDRQSKVPMYAAAGAVWADTARAYAALAAVLPEPATVDETPEV
ncbi:MAG: hypothetical protein HOY76_36250 [Streptomyces sp.]|nr:hypothetical protein [Streptomyces sp.]NUS75774.1 hypothetical protein [Streptomyces sp.]